MVAIGHLLVIVAVPGDVVAHAADEIVREVCVYLRQLLTS